MTVTEAVYHCVVRHAKGAPRTSHTGAPKTTVAPSRLANAIARGVFGSPFFVVDGESFWGNDRLDEVDAWLGTGGW